MNADPAGTAPAMSTLAASGPTLAGDRPGDQGFGPVEGVRRGKLQRWGARAGLLAVGVALYGPWLRPGYLMGYDWASGPHTKLPPSVYGFSQGRAVGAPVAAVARLLTPLPGGVDPVAVALLFSPLILGFGMEALIGDRPFAWFAAALLASANPFVDERLGAASFGVVLAMDMLPFAAAAARDAAGGCPRACVRWALLSAGGVVLCPQILLAIGVTTVLVVAACRWRRRERAPLAVASEPHTAKKRQVSASR